MLPACLEYFNFTAIFPDQVIKINMSILQFYKPYQIHNLYMPLLLSTLYVEMKQ